MVGCFNRLGIVCRTDSDTGKVRDQKDRFRHCDSNQNDCCSGFFVGNGIHRWLRRQDYRNTPTVFTVFDFVRRCHRGFMDLLLQSTIHWGNLSSQVQQQIGKDFRGGVPVEAFARTMIQLFCKLGQSLCRKRNLIGVFGNVLPQQTVDLLVRPSFPRRHGMRKINLQGRKRFCNLTVF